ncbi:MAG: creatininase family protein [Candidatus Edwardsbacteria bacterium]
MYSYKSSTKDLVDNKVDTAIISVGATEQCGPCLPFHIDTLCAEYCAVNFGKLLNAYVLPTLPFNTSEEHSHFKGTVSVSPTTLMTFLEEIVVNLKNQEFKKQVIISGHGGSYWLGAFIKHINYKYEDMILVNSHHNAGEAWQKALKMAGLDKRNEIHGGMISKCSALFFCPECVKEGEYGSKIAPEMNVFIDYGLWHRIAKDGSWGILTKEDNLKDLQEKGRILWENFVRLQAEHLKKHFEEACRLKGIT